MDTNSGSIEFNPMRASSKKDNGSTNGPQEPPRLERIVSNVENNHDLMIFDTIQVQFNPSVFFFQLFIHCFIFFSFLSPNPSAQGFWGNNFWFLFYNWGLTLILYIMIASYFLAPSATFVVLSGALWIPLIYFVQHKLVVALKYASLSTSEYLRFMNCVDPSITDIYRDQMQLIAAWLSRDEAVLEFEIGAAAIRVGSKLSDIFFSLPNPQKSISNRSQHSYWHAFLRGREFVDFGITDTDGLEKTTDGRYRVSVFSMITALVRRCDSRNFGESFCFYVIYFFCFLNIIIPLLILAASVHHQHASHDVNYVWVIVFYTSSTLINITYGPVVYNVLYVAIFDVLRQLQMVDELTAMIRISDLTLQAEDNGPDFELATISERMTMSTTDNGSTPSSTEASLYRNTVSPLTSPTVSRDSAMSFSMTRPSMAQIRGDRNMEAIYKINRTPSVSGGATRPSTAYLRDLSSMHQLHRRSIGRETKAAIHCPLTGTPQERDSRVSDVERASTASATMLRASTASCCSTTMDPTRALHRYTEIGERLAEDGGRAEIPRVSFDDVDNVLAWTFARLTLQNFGDRFRFRIDIYVGMCCSHLALYCMGMSFHCALLLWYL